MNAIISPQTMLFGFILAAFTFFPKKITAQLRLEAGDLPAIGDTIYFAVDESYGNIAPGPADTGLVWNLRDLYPSALAENIYLDPAQTPFAEDFAASNLALLVDFGEPAYSYLTQTDSCVLIDGLTLEVPQLGGQQLLRFADPQKTTRLPTELGTSFRDTARLSFAFTEPNTGAELLFRSTQYSYVETRAEGTVRLPGGDLPALQQRVVTERLDSLFVVVFDQANFFDSEQTVDTLQLWLSPETKGIAVSVNTDGDVTYYAPELANLQPPRAAFTFELGGNGQVDFFDASENTPFRWNWSFGDGSSSEARNTTHLYDSSGVYRVCLTVDNAVGADTTCQDINVMVTSIPTWPDEVRVSAFPNPARDQLQIRISGAATIDYGLRILGSDGRLIRRARLRDRSYRLPTGQWPPGLYRYQLIAPDGAVYTGTFVKVE